jgi:hypothetical protein
MIIAPDNFSTEEMIQVQMGYYPNPVRFRLVFETAEEAAKVQNILEKLLRESEDTGD